MAHLPSSRLEPVGVSSDSCIRQTSISVLKNLSYIHVSTKNEANAASHTSDSDLRLLLHKAVSTEQLETTALTAVYNSRIQDAGSTRKAERPFLS